METRRSGPSAHKRHTAAVIDGAVPTKKTKSVSVASIFKQQHQKTKDFDALPQIDITAPSSVSKDARARKVNMSKSLSSSRSPHKSIARASKKQSDLHPMHVESKDVNKTYRSGFYDRVSEKIDESLIALLDKLHEGTTVAVCSDDKADPKAHSTKLSAPAQYECFSKIIYRPLSDYTARYSRTALRGEEEPTETTIHERLCGFDEQIRKQTDEIKKLQSQWEAIVREIFKLGVTCLGEDTMKAMLLPTPAPQAMQDQPPSSPSEPESEFALFVHEKSKADKGKGKKKKVTFEQAESAVSLPEFLYQPSMFRRKIAPEVPRLSSAKVTKLQAEVDELGNTHVDELREIEKEYTAWWKKKTQLIASALDED